MRCLRHVHSQYSRPKSRNLRLALGFQRYQCLMSHYRRTPYCWNRRGKFWGVQLHQWTGILWERGPTKFYQSPHSKSSWW